MADMGRRIVQGVGEDDHAAAILTNQGSLVLVLGMVAHPERR